MAIKRVVVETDDVTYRKAKIMAIEEDISMKDFVKKALLKYISEKESVKVSENSK